MSSQDPHSTLVRPPFNWWTPEPLSDDSPSSVSTREIHFLHPGYSYPYNILFSLPALDRGGVHHGVALTACMIVSGNRRGCLSTSPNPPDPNPPLQPVLQTDDVLMEDEYYFHPEPGEMLSEAPYPICPDFKSWLFPHHRLPAEWAGLSMPAPSTTVTPTAYSHSHSCRITACSDGVSNTHIVPRDELEWFCFNSMALYNSNRRLPLSDLTLDPRNTIPLRQDIASALDAGTLVFVPKSGKVVVHVLASATTTYELVPLYHNRLVHPFAGAPPRELLYARFAYSVFPLLAGFFGGGSRRVCTAVRGEGRDGAGVRWDVEWIDWGDILRWRAGTGVFAKGVAMGGVPIVAVATVGEEGGEEIEEREEGKGERGGEGEESHAVLVE